MYLRKKTCVNFYCISHANNVINFYFTKEKEFCVLAFFFKSKFFYIELIILYVCCQILLKIEF